MGRIWVGIHYRSDDLLRLGEDVAIVILQYLAGTHTEDFERFSTRFDGTKIHFTLQGEVLPA
jgi:hypothetical protein